MKAETSDPSSVFEPAVAVLGAESSAKLEALKALLRIYQRVVVAFSGGVDSAFLLKIAYDTLQDGAVAFTAKSASLMGVELEAAQAFARSVGVRHEIVETHELERTGYVENSVERCYFCKKELFEATALLAERFPGTVVVDGFNIDDMGNHRPGHRAASEHAVRHPLAEAQLTKAEIRAFSKELGLPTWRKPQLACLSSRVPYGTAVTSERLGRIERVELVLRDLGFFDVRARLVAGNDDMVRLEIGDAQLALAVQPDARQRIVEGAKAAGFKFVTLDLEGFRSGRMNEGLVQLRRGK